MRIAKQPSKIIFYSTSSDDDSSSVKIEFINDLSNSSQIKKAKNLPNSSEYDYSYSSEDNIPRLVYTPQRAKLQPNTRNNIINRRRIAFTAPSSPKRLMNEKSSDSSILDEDNNLDHRSQNFSENLNSDSDPSKTTQQKKKIIEESAEIDNSLSCSQNINDNIELKDNFDIAHNQKDDEENYYNSYFCSRMKLNSPNNFTFNQQSNSLFYAKSKGIFSGHVYISSNENFNIKEKQYEYVMKISHNRTVYQLRKADEKNNLLVMRFNNNYGKEYGPRKISMEWSLQHIKYISRIPKKAENGKWELNFNGKYVIASQKNGIILDENLQPVIMIRKVQKAVLQIEVIHNIEPVYLFSLGIASFICPF